MEKNNGRWININGSKTFIEDGHSVQDSMKNAYGDKKGRKRIHQGKFEYSSDDGETWNEMSGEAYGEYDADQVGFDETVDDDYGFDEEEEKDESSKFEKIISVLKEKGIMDDFEKVKEIVKTEYGMDDEEVERFLMQAYGEDYQNKFESKEENDGEDEVEVKIEVFEKRLGRSLTDDERDLIRQYESKE